MAIGIRLIKIPETFLHKFLSYVEEMIKDHTLKRMKLKWIKSYQIIWKLQQLQDSKNGNKHWLLQPLTGKF